MFEYEKMWPFMYHVSLHSQIHSYLVSSHLQVNDSGNAGERGTNSNWLPFNTDKAHN